MINPDDLDPPRPVLKAVDFAPMSVEELQDYIVALEAEIARAEQAIAKKKAHKSDIEGLFRIP